MIVIRSRSFRLIVNVSMLWPGCYRNPAPKGTFLSSYHGDILMEFRHEEPGRMLPSYDVLLQRIHPEDRTIISDGLRRGASGDFAIRSGVSHHPARRRRASAPIGGGVLGSPRSEGCPLGWLGRYWCLDITNECAGGGKPAGLRFRTCPEECQNRCPLSTPWRCGDLPSCCRTSAQSPDKRHAIDDEPLGPRRPIKWWHAQLPGNQFASGFVSFHTEQLALNDVRGKCAL